MADRTACAASLHPLTTDPVRAALLARRLARGGRPDGLLHTRAAVGAARRARAAPGLEQALGLFESPLRFGSFSLWRSAAELKAFAYRPGAHRDAVVPYEATPWADDHVAVRFGVMR